MNIKAKKLTSFHFKAKTWPWKSKWNFILFRQQHWRKGIC